MQLIIKNKVINTPICQILEQIKDELPGQFFDQIKSINSTNVQVTCPFHSDGHEKHPSCFIYNRHDNPEVEYGFVKCFTCGKKMPLYAMIGYCFGQDDEFGKDWLIERFGNVFIETQEILPEIVLNSCKNKNYIDESILDNYNYFHPYMFERKLSKDIIVKYRIGYDKFDDTITFPCWDQYGHLISINKRKVSNKKYILAKGVEKAVYLLNFIKKDNITDVYVTESQINALTLESWGYRAVALMGTGSKEQYEILNKSGIRNYHLCLDGDFAGRKGSYRFIKNINNDVMIDIYWLPDGKDVNDLDYNEFLNLPRIDKYDFIDWFDKNYKNQLTS